MKPIKTASEPVGRPKLEHDIIISMLKGSVTYF